MTWREVYEANRILIDARRRNVLNMLASEIASRGHRVVRGNASAIVSVDCEDVRIQVHSDHKGMNSLMVAINGRAIARSIYGSDIAFVRAVASEVCRITTQAQTEKRRNNFAEWK